MATDKKPIGLRLSPELKALGEQRAKDEGRSFASYVERLIIADLQKHGLLPERQPSSAKQNEAT